MNSGFLARYLLLFTLLTVAGFAATFSKCDVHQDGVTNRLDVQRMSDEAAGVVTASHDLNNDVAVNVLDIQIVINAALGLGCVADPAILSIAPNTGQQAASPLNVTITGRLTNFANSSTIDLGAGITASNVLASNATTLTAALAIAADATPGVRSLTVDGLTLPNGFTVTLRASVSYTYDGQGRLVSANYTSTSGAVLVIAYSYDAAGNRTAVVAQ